MCGRLRLPGAGYPRLTCRPEHDSGCPKLGHAQCGTAETKSSRDRPLPDRTLHRLADAIGTRLENVAWHSEAIRAELDRMLPRGLPVQTDVLADRLMRTFPQPFSPGSKRIAASLLHHPVLPELARHCTRHDIWPAPHLTPPVMAPAPAFATLDLPVIDTPAALAAWLLLPPEALDGYVDRFGWRQDHGDMAVNHYVTRLLPKPNGSHRLIEAPKPRLKAFQRQILAGILAQVPQHGDSFAFRTGRDCRSGAARHAGEEVVIGFDMQDFFSSIPYGRVFGLFRCLGYPASVAHALTGLCTVITPARVRDRLPYDRRQRLRMAHLPQGAPTSPALSNIICDRLDRRLAGLARSVGAQYSRYADDMTFSGDRTIIAPVRAAVPEIVRDAGFSLNAAKTRIMPTGARQVVTGLVVNDHLNIARRDIDRLKAVIHAGRWMSDKAVHDRLMGQIGWVRNVNPAKADKLAALMRRAAERAG